MVGIYKVLFVIAITAVAAIGGTSISLRQGNLNSYFLYTRTNSRTPVTIDTSNLTAATTEFNDTVTTVVIVHGHRGSATTTLNPQIKDALLSAEDVNVIVVDWSVYASQSYSVAMGAVPSIAVYLASLITELVDAGVVTLAATHLVGFDLGAHVVGFAGRQLNGEVARITGLNPSGSQWGSNSQRLRQGDALYVEVIHTDGGSLLANGIGEAIGDVDFFANGGNNQPGCLLNNLCSHNRAYELFAASLTTSHLVGNQCTNMLQNSLNTCRGYTLALGNNELSKYGTGIFRANTGRTYPY